MKRNERERFAELFQQLVHADTQRDSEADAALRVLSHALLNYWGARQNDDAAHNAQITAQMTRALPWLAAFLASAEPQTDHAPIARQLLETSGRNTLSEEMIARRLDALAAAGGAAFSATPRDASTHPDRHLDIFCALAHTERRLAALGDLDAQGLRDALVDDTFLLAAAAERCEEAGAGEHGGAATPSLLNRLRDAIEPWRASDLTGEIASLSKPIWVLAGLDESDETGALMGAGTLNIAAKSRRFESGLAANMERMGFISAVRAALAFAPIAADGAGAPPAWLASADARAAFLRDFSVFRADESLLQLASALMETRGVCLDYLRGGAPLGSLSPWIDYLRGECAELAEARECTLREAISYAHYCLHLVNICDFAALELTATEQAALSEATREALCQVEDELKEFALLGQREGLSDAQADLGRFERARWRREGDASFLADRLSRLRGAWRSGVTPGPIGAPPRLDPDVSAHSLAIIDNLLAEAGESELSGLATIASNARFHGYQWLELLAPPDILKLIAICTSAARDLPGVDITKAFDVDLSELGAWASDPARGRLNRRILSMLLARREMADILNGDAAGQDTEMALRRGLVTHTRAAGGQLSPAHLLGGNQTVDFGAPAGAQSNMGPNYLVLQFVADPELKALLDLMGTSSAEDPAFHALLEQRLQVILHRHDAGDSAETMLDDSSQVMSQPEQASARAGASSASSTQKPSSTQAVETFSSSQPAAN
ncbi:hypothetical protein [Bradymonas sediminis]|uniref:Uncharacterized protein n=1 Tax=Bradymonas sediminis TaxID=1548548 RepID=A0A2Z4FJ93_9DELT|nr:hypothetical protein [Bradymonas sediminis]AWV88999.1 hypothetical protein DN745_06450 [Bradymonas sediminis]TDP72013.1 hypothetical protein DFR33_108227 [Bradymonas sediminis]